MVHNGARNDHLWHTAEKEPVTKTGQILTVEIRHTLWLKEAKPGYFPKSSLA